MKANNLKIWTLLLMTLLFFNCKNEKKTELTEETIVEEVIEVIEEPSNVIDIVTRSMEFQSVDTIPSGWNTFKYQNLSNETHFFLMDKYPEGKTVEHTLTDVAPSVC
ncbi:hypothetical protein [Xanthomarina gelatinilytica]|uniref:hypothetical protein n=1 Tax=Xanthomarina gelatinilytica TaxID=1137281 RepID=UPI003AA83064